MPDLSLVVENALLITLASGEDKAFTGWFSVDDLGKIVDIGPGDPPAGLDAAERLDAEGKFVAPGFVSAHSHLSTSGSRGLGIDVPLYGWGDAMTHYTRYCNAEDIYWVVLHGALDFLGNGVTTAYDFTDSRLPFAMIDGKRQQFGGLKPKEYAEAQFRAKIDAGIRFINSIHINDQVGTDEEIAARFAETLDYCTTYPDSGQYLGTSISGAVQWSETPETARREVELMRRHGVINQPHFLETPEQMDVQRAKFSWYEQAGALGPDLIFGHFVHPTDNMITTAIGCGCAMCWQPTSNGRLASGVADIPRYLREGMRVGVGLDDQACTDISDPFQNMRMGIYIQRAHRQDAKAMGVAQMLRLHTMGSAEILGIEDKVGSLEAGKYADFLLVDPRQPDTGPLWNPIASYVLACGLRNLKQVYVGGRCVSREGVSQNALAPRASEELHDRLGRIARTLAKPVPA
jgi:cytosine/adenosine deaminase-related metal-dependent hydrolase